MAWAGLVGGPLAGAALIVAWVITRIGERGAPPASAWLVHGIAIVLVALAAPASVALLRRPAPPRRSIAAAGALVAAPCALWVLNSVGVLWGATSG